MSTHVSSDPADFGTWLEAHAGEFCKCGLACKQIYVKKEGKNKGKEFYACPGAQGDQCGYFCWGGKYRQTKAPQNGGGGGIKRAREPDPELGIKLAKLEDGQGILKSMMIGVQNELISLRKLLGDE